MAVKNWRTPLREKLLYIAPDGEVFHLHSPSPKHVISTTGWGSPLANIAETRGPYQHGSTPLSIRLTPRRIMVNIRHNGNSREEFWANRYSLLDALRWNRTNLNNPSTGILRYYRADGVIRQADVIVTDGPAFPNNSGGWDEFSYMDNIEFTAYNPIIYDPPLLSSVHSDFAASSFTQLTFPFTFVAGVSLVFGSSQSIATQNFVLNYLGNWFEYPTVEISGPATDPVITNQTTGDVLALEGYTIASNEVVTFDLSYSRKTVTNNSGDNLLGYLAPDSDLGDFSFVPGTNTINIAIEGGSVATSVMFYYKHRYTGM